MGEGAVMTVWIWIATLLLCCLPPAVQAQPTDTRRSGFDAMGPALQAMQRDDAQNPAMLWVKDAEQAWGRAAGRSGKSCADCHGATPSVMRGVATRYPLFYAASARPINLGQRINQCVEQRQQAPALAAESAALLGMETLVAQQSRALPLQPATDARLAPFLAQGQALYGTRMGQLNLSCAQCHDERAGLRLGGSPLVQGHVGGYPTYRLEWQALGSLQRRLRGCLSGVRAEAFADGADDWVALEAWLMRRAAGLLSEGAGVRP